MVNKWYFKYDPEKGNEFIPGAIRAEEQPENATDVEPTGFHGFPKWNESTKKWEGQSIDDYLAKAKEAAANNLDPTQEAMSNLAIKLMQTSANLSARITALENEREEKDV